MMTDRHAYRALRLLTFFLVIGLAGCAGGYGAGEGAGDGDSAGTDTPGYSAGSEGQKLLLERTQARDEMLKKTQQSDVAAPESAAKRPCEGFPGFDRGCPGGGK